MRTLNARGVWTFGFAAGCLILALGSHALAQPCVDDLDEDGICDADDNCVSSANPLQHDTFGSSSGPISGDACEPQNLNLTKVKARAGGAGASKGRIAIKGDFILKGGDTFTGADGIEVRVRDSLVLDQHAGGPSSTIECSPANRAIRCKASDPLFSASFKFSLPNPMGDVAVRYSLKIAKLDLNPLFDAPLGLTMTDLTNGLELKGNIVDCALANGSITCRDF